MARGKALTEEEVETYYMLILEYGQDKGGMSNVNRRLQEMLHPDLSIEEIYHRFSRANPNSKRCTPERRKKFEKIKRLKSGQMASLESRENAKRTQDLVGMLQSRDLTRVHDKLWELEGKDFIDAWLAIHKTIAANVREKIEINALIDLLNANEDME